MASLATGELGRDIALSKASSMERKFCSVVHRQQSEFTASVLFTGTGGVSSKIIEVYVDC